MTPARVLPLGLLLLLWAAPAARAQEKPEMTAYREGAMARADEMLDKNAEAMEHFDRSLALVPDPIIYSNRGDLKKKLKDLPGAIADYDKAIAMKPQGLDILYGNRALMKHQSGDLDGAIADYGAVIALKPASPIIYNNRGYAWITKGDRAKAIADYAKAAELEPKTVKFRENLANARRDAGDRTGALADLSKLVSLEPGNPFRHYMRGDLKDYMGDFAGAVKDFSRCLELRPDAWPVYFRRGRARQAQGDLKGALVDYDKSVSGNPEHEDFAWAYREIVLRRMKRGSSNEELSKIAAKGRAGFPNDIVLYLGGALAESDLLAKADQGSAEVMAGKRCVSSYFVGMNRLAAGDKDAAVKFLEQSVAAKRADVIESVLARAELARLKKPH